MIVSHCKMQRPPNPRGLLLGLDGSPTLLKPNTVLHLVLSQPSPSLLPWFTLGRWLGFGFITFEAEQSVDQAVNMHFHDIMGKKVCSCSFILPIKSSRVLGDSKSVEIIFCVWVIRLMPRRQVGPNWSCKLLCTHTTSHLLVLPFGRRTVSFTNVIKKNLRVYCHPRLCLNRPLL